MSENLVRRDTEAYLYRESWRYATLQVRYGNHQLDRTTQRREMWDVGTLRAIAGE